MAENPYWSPKVGPQSGPTLCDFRLIGVPPSWRPRRVRGRPRGTSRPGGAPHGAARLRTAGVLHGPRPPQHLCGTGLLRGLVRAGPLLPPDGVFLAGGSPVTKGIITLSGITFTTICAACSVQGGQRRRAQPAACNQTLAEGITGRGWSGSEKATELAQNLGQLQPFLAAFPQECMGQLASFGPT